MDSQLSPSELAICADNYMEKAWHLVSVLISIGRPASPAELAGKCSLFRSPPEFIEFLCFIANSPLFLTKNGFVLPSAVAFRTVGRFFTVMIPKFQIDVFGATTSFHGRRGDVLRKYFRKRKKVGNDLVMPAKKRAVLRSSIEGNELEKSSFGSSVRIVLDLNAVLTDTPMQVALGNFNDMAVTPLKTTSDVELLGYRSNNDEDQGSGHKKNASQVDDMHKCVEMERGLEEYYSNNGAVIERPEAHGEIPGPFFKSLAEIEAFLGIDELDPIEPIAEMDTGASLCTKHDQLDYNTVVEPSVAHDSNKDLTNKHLIEARIDDIIDQPLDIYSFTEARAEKETHSIGSLGVGSFFEDNLCHTPMGSTKDKQPTLLEETANNKEKSKALVPAKPQSGSQNSLAKFPADKKNGPQLKSALKQKGPLKLQNDSKVGLFHKDSRVQKDKNNIVLRDNATPIGRNGAAVHEKCAEKSLKDQQKSKFPEFDSYTVEEEEGSGGYGTVYRARRKTDGVAFAVKCPHPKAHTQHMKNELKMLERFGGKNFVIKYHGSLKSGNADCFVLEHVEHDRPEALKREIQIYELQWYGFCLFKALASLHKKGVFHRDVKPGNFLFSCKTTKGYLIDFNLAKDLHQKPGSLDKSLLGCVSSTQQVAASQPKFASPNKRRKILSGKVSEAFKAETTSINHPKQSKSLTRKAVDKLKAYDDLGRRNSMTSQGADGSGLTSKDLTSARTSGEKLREPIPCQGRRELINLAQEAMQSPNLGTGSVPVSQRKRVAASPVFMNRKFIYLTPTPLHSSGNAVSGAGSSKNRGDVKPQKEGPCVGTKGFRAPEVLLRSSYQGPKIDVWSAGVTLLYLITGKMPFTGDPEQNMKDIVKIKGNEDLWEVAKLHNRENSFPMELLDVSFLQSMTIKEWCLANTKRLKFFDAIPTSLFDLIEKCLTVNPRLRITADEAVNHEFFARCHDTIEKMKLRKPSQNQRSGSNSLPVSHQPVGTSCKPQGLPVNF